jgi:hypothetical protein
VGVSQCILEELELAWAASAASESLLGFGDGPAVFCGVREEDLEDRGVQLEDGLAEGDGSVIGRVYWVSFFV